MQKIMNIYTLHNLYNMYKCRNYTFCNILKSHKNHTSIIREFSVYTPIKPIFKNCQLDNIIPILTKNIDKTLFLTAFLSLFFVVL